MNTKNENQQDMEAQIRKLVDLLEKVAGDPLNSGVSWSAYSANGKLLLRVQPNTTPILH